MLHALHAVVVPEIGFCKVSIQAQSRRWSKMVVDDRRVRAALRMATGFHAVL